MVVKFDGKELAVRKGKKGWAGWFPEAEDERLMFKRRALCPGRSRASVKDDQEGELEALQGRLEEAAAVKVTTTATRNQKVPGSGQRSGSWPRKRHDAKIPSLRKELRKELRKNKDRPSRGVGLYVTWWEWLKGLGLWDSVTGADARTCGVRLCWGFYQSCPILEIVTN